MSGGLVGAVLAAGAGRRFGEEAKQLAPVGGRPLLERVLAATTAAPSLDRVLVTLGARADEIRAAVDLHGAEPVAVADWEEGVAASLRAAVAAAGADAAGLLVVLGDQALLDTETVERVAAASAGGTLAARAVHEGRPGHPVVLPRRLLPRVAELRGDRGAAALLAAERIAAVACGPAATLDVDRPEQLAAVQRHLAVVARAAAPGRRGRAGVTRRPPA